ncbi:MAG: SIS domain-containing protein [Terriglobales bacterium]
MAEGLRALMDASDDEKLARGTRHTPREIFQQPLTWKKTYKICADRRRNLSQFLDASGIRPEQKTRPTVFLVGAGTSDYIGGALTYLLRRLWGCDVWAVPSTDLLTNLDDLVIANRSYLWVSFSRSGDSSEGLAVLDAALQKYPKIRHLLITCNQESRMVAVCEKVPERTFVLALDDTANDRGLAMTSSYTNMVIAGHCLAHAFLPGDYEHKFAMLLEAGEKFLQRAEEVANAIEHENFSRACFVGSGMLRAVAQESALKLLELTAGRIQTFSESTLGLRHGPMSALDENTVFVSFLSRDPRRRNYEVDLLREVNSKKLGKRIIVVTPYVTDDLSGLADHVLSLHLPQLGDEYRAPVDVILAQMLGLFFSLRFGLQPDCPSPNGVIGRVVSNVKIYP